MSTLESVAELSSSCVCENDEMEFCEGECYKDARDYIEERFFGVWARRVGLDERRSIAVVGTRMNWLGTSGVAIIRPDFEALMDVLTLNGEFRLVFTLTGYENPELVIRRYSHDEPTGSPRFVCLPSDEDYR